jgi:hypothetical protein
LYSLADWYLLSHAEYFVGSFGSTFSILIANYVSARAYIKQYKKLQSQDHLEEYSHRADKNLIVSFPHNLNLWINYYVMRIDTDVRYMTRSVTIGDFGVRECDGISLCCFDHRLNKTLL